MPNRLQMVACRIAEDGYDAVELQAFGADDSTSLVDQVKNELSGLAAFKLTIVKDEDFLDGHIFVNGARQFRMNITELEDDSANKNELITRIANILTERIELDASQCTSVSSEINDLLRRGTPRLVDMNVKALQLMLDGLREEEDNL